MGVIIGVFIGYALGTRAGEEGWEELSEALTVIATSQEVKDLIVGGVSMARDLLERGSGMLSGSIGGSSAGGALRPVA